MFIPPPGNDSTNLCAGLEELRASLPQPPVEFQNANLALYIIYLTTFFVFAAPAIYCYRDHPRFSKVRPFWVLLFMLVCASFISTATFLRLANEEAFPCALMVVMWLFGMQGLGGVLIIRSLLFVVESELQRKLRVRTLKFESDIVELIPPNVSTVREILSVGLGIQDIEDVEVNQLAKVKQAGFLALMACLIMFPPLVASIVLLSAYPCLFHCNGCYAFTEILIAVLCCNVPNILVIMRIAYVGYKRHRKRDAQGVINEFVMVCVLVLPLVTVSYFLEIFDPGQLDVNYKFEWEAILMLSGALFFTISVAWQVVFAVRQSYKEKKVYSRSRTERMVELSEKTMLAAIVSEDDEVSKQFETFAVQNLVIELVHFIRDVDAFKRYFQEKGDNWRLQKAKLLVTNYVRMGSSAEVNVSDAIKRAIIDVYKSVESGKSSTMKLYSMFDDAYSEVVKMLLHGAWMRFILTKKTETSPRLAKSRDSTYGKVMPGRDESHD